MGKSKLFTRLRRGSKEAVAARHAAERAALGIQALATRFEESERYQSEALAAHIAGLQSQVSELHERMRIMLRAVYDEEPANRRRLHDLRQQPSYLAAFEDENPLVSILIPTVNRPELLVDRAIASIVGQSHTNLEIVVVGDGASEATDDALASVTDERVRYFNRTMNGPAIHDAHGNWLASGSIPVNEALGMARGAWIVPFADDDSMRPDHLKLNLDAARRNGWEVCYGKWANHRAVGSIEIDGEFPPRHLHFAWQSGIYHAGLRFMNVEANAALFGEPNDFGLIRRMMAIGVRVGAIDDVVADYYPSYRGEAVGESEAIAVE